MADFIEVRDVLKQYSGHLALDHVNMNVPEGCVYGLLGHNGAGKSTLIRIINLITSPDSGQVLLGGNPITPDDVCQIGYMPEERGLYKKMKVGEEIVYLARLKGLDKATAHHRAHAWLERMGLADWENKKVETLSKGMQQKVQFIATVVHEPRLLIFDEPFSGFDPVNADQLKQEILRLRDNGATILFSTHNMESVEEICDRITLIDHSQVVLEGEVPVIKQRYKKNLFEVELAHGEALPQHAELYTLLPPREPGRGTLVRLNDGVELREVIAKLNGECSLQGFHELLPSMHDIFVQVVRNG